MTARRPAKTMAVSNCVLYRKHPVSLSITHISLSAQ
jgi:hypothetical protein